MRIEARGYNKMQGVAGTVALFVAVMSSVPALGAGGLVQSGVGTGTSVASDGSWVCEGASFHVVSTFVPGNRAVAHFYWLSPSTDCTISGGALTPVYGGGSLALGSLHFDLSAMPPATWEFGCVGNEAEGLECGDFLAIGPSSGLGSVVWLRKTSVEETFVGSFVSV